MLCFFAPLLVGPTAAEAAPPVTEAAPSAPRQMSLNHDWKFLRTEAADNADMAPSAAAFDDSAWDTVTLPHTAHVEPLVAHQMWQGVCWYRKHLTMPPSWAGRKVAVDFGAAMSVAQVWVNGRPAATHYGGFLPFSVDLTDDLHSGDNVIAVRLDNRDNEEVPPGKPYKDLDFTWYSGLYRNVSLRVTDRLHISDAVEAGLPASGGVFVTFPEADAQRATAAVRLHVVNENSAAKKCRARFTLVDAQGQAAAQAETAPIAVSPGTDHVFAGTLAVANPHLWSPDHPNLYQLRSEIVSDNAVTDMVQTRIGIRRISFSASGGFQINGQKMYLRGTNRHQEYPYLGYALSDNAQYRDALKIKEAGFDFVRLSHYPNSPAFLDACDELGLVVMEPIPGWQFMGDALFKQRAIQDARDMVRRDRNHPSLMLWETSLNETHMDKPFMDALAQAAHEEYPGDQCYTAGWQDDFDVFLQSRQAGGCHGYKNGDKACEISEYGDWEYYARNMGLNQKAGHDKLRPEWTSRQTRADGEARLRQQAVNFQEAANDNRSTPAFGDGAWLMYDYSRGYDPTLETSGAMDSLRLPKFAYSFFQSQRDADTPALPGVQSGPMVSIASWWSASSPTDVLVYSNCAEVELSLNGKIIARQKPDVDSRSNRLPHPPFTFPLGRFTPGTLKAVGLIAGLPKATETVRTPGAPVSIRLRYDRSGRPLAADGADAVFVYADIVDAAGTVVRSASLPIQFSVVGPAHLVGDNPVSATAGQSGILLQAGDRVGPIVVQASAAGLSPGRLSVP